MTKQEQLGRAFAAAFGNPAQAKAQVNGQTVVYRPGTIRWIGDRAVLISPAKSTDDCHACAGTLAVHYLKASGDRFEVTGSWPDVVPGTGWGAAPKWKLSEDFTEFPAIFAEGTGGGQGFVCTTATLVELAPSGPVKSGPIPLHYDNEGAATDPQANKYNTPGVRKLHRYPGFNFGEGPIATSNGHLLMASMLAGFDTLGVYDRCVFAGTVEIVS